MSTDQLCPRSRIFSIAICAFLAIVLLAPSEASAQAQIFWSDQDAGYLGRAGIDGSGVEQIVRIRLDSPAAVEVDMANGKVYWAGLGEVGRADLDGTDVEAPIVLGEEVFFRDQAVSVAIHAGEEKIYWLSDDRIYRADFDGSNQEEAVGSGIFNAEDIAIDEAAGKIYWTNNSFSGGAVKRSDLDGSNQEDLVTGLFQAQKLALDVDGGKMYYANLITNDVYRANLDGSEEEAIVEDQDNPDGVTLDLVNGKVYWTDRTEDAVRRANLDGSSVEDLPIAVTRPIDVAVDPAGGQLFVIEDDGALIKATLDGTDGDTFISGVSDIAEIAVDEVRGKIYWGDRFGAGRLQRANLDGSDIETVHDEATESMYVDEAAGMVYWSVRTAIYRADPDGSNREMLVDTNDARQLVVDPSSGRMFWFGDANPPTMVMSANLDGSDVQVVADNLSDLDHLVLDAANESLFWYGNDGTLGVFRAGTDGSNVTRIVDDQAFGGVAVDSDGGKVYWSDRSIYRANQDGSGEEELLDSSTGFTMSNLTVDSESGLMYWTTTDDEIRRAGLDGSSPETIVTGIVGVEDIAVASATDTRVERRPEQPTTLKLTSVYPNPLRTRTTVELSANRTQHIQVDLYNVLGEQVSTVYAGPIGANGRMQLDIDASGLSSGAYLLRVQGTESTVVRSLIVRK